MNPHRYAVAVLLALTCLVLRFAVFPYDADYVGHMPPQSGSLAHLQAGVMFAMAMLMRDRLALRLTVAVQAVVWIGITARTGGLGPAVAAGVPLFATAYGLLVGCAKLAGFPRDPVFALSTRDIARIIVSGMVVLPVAWMLVGGVFEAPWMPHAFALIANNALQTLAAKHFGISALLLPVMLWATSRGWERPLHGFDRSFAVLFLIVVAAFASLLVQGDATSPATATIVEYRLLLGALAAWAVMRLPVRLSMPVLAMTLVAIIYAVARESQGLGEAVGLQRLALLAVELVVLQAVICVLFVVTRDTRMLQRRLEKEASADSLTALPNLKALRERVADHPPREPELGYLLLDNIEQVFAGLGLNAHTALMTEVRARLVGIADAFYLTSGQFALLRHESAERTPDWRHVIEALETFEFRWEASSYRVAPYLGVSRLRGASDTAIDTAIAAASQAAIQARMLRETHPVRASRPTPSPGDIADPHRERLAATSDILGRIRTGQLLLYFQPICRVGAPKNAAITSGEVVCRLRMADGSLRSPGSFTTDLEANGRLVELDRAVLRQLFAWLGQYRHAVAHIEHLGVNLTGQSLASTSFMRELLSLMRHPPLPARAFCFEVTESALGADLGATREGLDALRELGCRIAIDDFGTGVQSFERLKQLPFDVLKIDGSFVRNAPIADRDYQLVQASVTIARAFGAETVAEYVESRAILDCMRRIGVDWAQGYVIGKPQPIQAILSPDVRWPVDPELALI
ncbi:EAL domain-containing protein [Dokdonella sp. MW10]|uniref:EAL domain-containing protein n=1 Tax=Dokdonella sp. MW10 TaxID=2992926 RepID=UPI003F81775C